MNLTILMAASQEWSNLTKDTVPDKQRYANKWGANFKFVLHQPGVDIAWDRARIWLEELEKLEEGNWMWFLGSDTLIMDHSVDWKTRVVLPVDFIIGLDVNGINCDSFFIRKCRESIEYLQAVINLKGKSSTEQDALRRCIGDMRINVAIRPQREFNSYLYSEYGYPDDFGGSYQEGDFVLHFPGMSHGKRLELIRKYKNKINQA